MKTENPKESLRNPLDRKSGKPSRVRHYVDFDGLQDVLPVPMSISTLRRHEASGLFPPRIKITPRKSVWDLEAVEAFIQKRVTEAKR